MVELHWSNADQIGYLLSERYPDVNPLTIRFTDLHDYVVQLDGFIDGATASTESILEAIQMAWLGYFQDQ